MNTDFKAQLGKVSAWAAKARAAGWLHDRDLERLAAIETGSAAELFRDEDSRPLVVAFFGGTGVGKSSLLNRLAGHPIARVGIRRPTSIEATMYLHRSRELNVFAKGSPIADTRVEYHDVDARRDVAWLDMPDIDSVEAGNRQLVLAWLPYVDWLVYVVSPERYRDDTGWQLLQHRHRKHHWMFVVNRWDEAVDVQLPDFVADLEESGFHDPLVLRTSCLPDREDDFDRLEEVINAAIHDHGLAELQRIGVLARLEELERAGDEMQSRIGSDGDWAILREQFEESVGNRLALFEDRIGAELEFIAHKYPPRPAIWRAEPAPPALPEAEMATTIGSTYTTDLIADLSTDMAVRVEQRAVRSGPVRERMQGALANAGTVILTEVRNGLVGAMRSPDGHVRHLSRRVMDILVYLLPLATGLWIAWNVVSAYRQGVAGEGAFLGIDFAVHSFMMIGLAWFVPFLLSRWLRPSLRDAARRGIRAGVGRAAGTLRGSLFQALGDSMQERKELLAAFPKTGQPGGRM